MTPFGTHRNDPVLTGITDHNEASARVLSDRPVTQRDAIQRLGPGGPAPWRSATGVEVVAVPRCPSMARANVPGPADRIRPSPARAICGYRSGNSRLRPILHSHACWLWIAAAVPEGCPSAWLIDARPNTGSTGTHILFFELKN
jgi:hypothetical protein